MSEPPAAGASALRLDFEERAYAIAAGVAAAVAFLPFLRGVLAGHSFFFRDLSRQFFPLRLFALEGLRRGELRFWNPFDNEGVPLSLMPAGYPLELLQALWPSPMGLTLVLALHVPLAAIAFVVLARHLGLRPLAAAGGAIVYALGGFTLSMISLYVYVHAMAWAPLVIWGLLRAADGRSRAVALAAVLCGIALSTTGVELVLQAMIVAGALCLWPFDVRRVARIGAAVLLGLMLSAPVLAALGSATLGTARAAGFSPDVVLNQSVHPFTFLQIVVGDLYGKLSNVTNEWWGVNFFENGFPYVLSLYLGAATFALAAAGLAGDRAPRGRLVALAIAAVAIALGRFAGWAAVVDHLPAALRAFRFPTKAFFTVHFATALLAAWGLDAIASGHRRARAALAATALAVGGLLTLSPALPHLLPGGTAWFLAHFFPDALAAAARARIFDAMTADAALGGGIAVLLGLAALAPWPGAVGHRRLGLIAIGLVGADLLRTGAALNPTIDTAFFHPSPAVLDAVAALRPQRIHTCEPVATAAYWRGRAARERHEIYTFAVWRDTLAPHYNMTASVPSALSEDTTSLVPLDRLTPPGASCRRFEALAPTLRRAGVTHVVSLDPVESPLVADVGTARPDALAPEAVHFYALADPLPRVAVEPGGTARIVADESDRVAIEVDASGPARVILRDGYARGWTARVNGDRAPLAAHDGRHRAVEVPAGRSVVEMRYEPPGWRLGLLVMAVAAAAVAALSLRSGRGLSATVASPDRSAATP